MRRQGPEDLAVTCAKALHARVRGGRIRCMDVRVSTAQVPLEFERLAPCSSPLVSRSVKVSAGARTRGARTVGRRRRHHRRRGEGVAIFVVPTPPGVQTTGDHGIVVDARRAATLTESGDLAGPSLSRVRGAHLLQAFGHQHRL